MENYQPNPHKRSLSQRSNDVWSQSNIGKVRKVIKKNSLQQQQIKHEKQNEQLFYTNQIKFFAQNSFYTESIIDHDDILFIQNFPQYKNAHECQNLSLRRYKTQTNFNTQRFQQEMIPLFEGFKLHESNSQRNLNPEKSKSNNIKIQLQQQKKNKKKQLSNNNYSNQIQQTFKIIYHGNIIIKINQIGYNFTIGKIVLLYLQDQTQFVGLMIYQNDQFYLKFRIKCFDVDQIYEMGKIFKTNSIDFWDQEHNQWINKSIYIEKI